MVRKCSVVNCKGEVDLRFPGDRKLRSEWLNIIGRPYFEPHRNAGLCLKHFTPSDFAVEAYDAGTPLLKRRLKRGAVPSISVDDRDEPCTPKKNRKLSDEPVLILDCPSPEPVVLPRNESDLGVEELPEDVVSSFSGEEGIVGDMVTIATSELNENVTQQFNNVQNSFSKADKCCGTEVRLHNVFTQTSGRLAPYTIKDFLLKPQELHDLTGLESYERFMLVFYSLGPNVHNIRYRNGRVRHVSVEDQLFLTVWKLRKATSDVELGMHFGINHTTVSNIFHSFVCFMAEQWGKLNIWPFRALTDYYMPQGFRKQYPTTRVIVDGTEIPIQKPKNPAAQQATFSTYKNEDTFKFVLGGSPSGLTCLVSEGFGGSTSDRQVIERSALPDLCEKGDSIMADRGFNVQDIFASKGVAINIPAFLRGKDHLPGKVIMRDRKLASKRVHIERLIGLTKVYKMLRVKLSHFHSPIASEIFYVCAMLSNFKNCIVSKKG